MSVIWIEGVPHRERRGKLVPIPEQWFGQTVSHQKIGRRYSKNRIKKIDSKQDRARDRQALFHGDESADARRTRTKWYRSSGEIDGYRDKYKRERKESHPSRDPQIQAPK